MSERLLFVDLKSGEKFIVFPLDGDNDGHGGYKGEHYIFMKAKRNNGEYFAIKLIDKVHSDISDSMEIIKVK